MDKKQILTIAGFIILILAIPGTFFLVRQTQVFKSRASDQNSYIVKNANGSPLPAFSDGWLTTTDQITIVVNSVQSSPSPATSASPAASSSPGVSPSPSPAVSPSPSPNPSSSPGVSPSPSPDVSPSPSVQPSPSSNPLTVSSITVNGQNFPGTAVNSELTLNLGIVNPAVAEDKPTQFLVKYSDNTTRSFILNFHYQPRAVSSPSPDVSPSPPPTVSPTPSSPPQPSPSSTSSSHLLTNGNFESGQLNPWVCEASTDSCEITTPPTGNSSAKAVKVHRVSTDARISQNISASPGNSLCLSFKMYGATNVAMYGQLYNGDAVAENFVIDGDGAWQTIEKNISIPGDWNPNNAIYWQLMAYRNNSTVWFDDISLARCN